MHPSGGASPSPLPAREAYRLWAGSYDGENPVSFLDRLAVAELTPGLSGLALLDAGCGTARRLAFDAESGPRLAIGVDLVVEMLAEARRHPERSRRLAAGDLLRLPIAAGAFDVAWCRLVAGHLEGLGPLYRELARAVRPGGAVVVTDFHPEAARRGHVRSFRDAAGARRLVEHHVHEPAEHEAAARAAGLELRAFREPAVGPSVRPAYEEAGSLGAYERDRGLPLVAAFLFAVPERRAGRR